MKLDFPDQGFDLVLCQQGLQFFSDRGAALREIRRVLKAEGRTVVSVWQDLDRHPVFKTLFEATAHKLGANVSDFALSFSLGDAGELRALFQEAGFGRIEVAPRSLEIRLPSPERFVQLTVSGAATSVPAFMRLSPEARSELVEAIAGDLAPVIEGYIEDREFGVSHVNAHRGRGMISSL